MRTYATIAPQFWTGKTGKIIREHGADAQRVALYLLSCPSASALGLYYLPIPTLCHEVGISKDGASMALRCLSDALFAHYDWSSEYIWVPEMARFQIAESLQPGDTRVKWITKELLQLSKTPFFNDFLEKYQESFKLKTLCPIDAPSMPLASPIDAKNKNKNKNKNKIDCEGEHASAGGNGKVKLHTFRESPYFDPFELTKALHDWPESRVLFYYENMLSASDARGLKYLNWSAVATQWYLRDLRDGKKTDNLVKLSE